MKFTLLSKALKTSLMGSVALGAMATFAIPAMAQETAVDADETNMDEINVTSRKRQELLTEVPMNIAVVGAEEIAHRNLVNKEDVYRSIAGAASPRGQLILRGLAGSNDSTPDTTTTFTDGIPYNFSNLYDVERIEVLRGPQGTLWGSNAIGGTVQIITNRPNLNESQMSGSALVTAEKNRPGVGTRASGMFNLPIIEDTLALRVTGSSGANEGKIYNTKTGTSGKESDYFLRSQLLWQPNEDTRINFTWVNSHSYDSATSAADRSTPENYYDAILTANGAAPYGYDVAFDFPSCPTGAERSECFGAQLNGHNPKFAMWQRVDSFAENDEDLAILNIERDDIISGVDFIYSGSWRKNSYLGRQGGWSREDSSDLFDTWIIDKDGEDRWTHEMRLQSNDDGPLQWTLGAFYDKSSGLQSPDIQWQYHASDNKSRAIASYLWGDYWGMTDPSALGQTLYGDPTKNYNYTVYNWVTKELALFGEAGYTADLGDNGRMEFTAGLRYYNLKDDLHDEVSGIWIDPYDLTSIETITKSGEDGFRKKFSVNYMPNDNFSLFALYSEGYRPGGNNGPKPPNDCAGDENIGSYVDRYSSDQIKNYEIGFKGFALDRKIRFSSAIYQIDWSGVQANIYMPSCGFSYKANAATARTKGIEFESTSNLTDKLKIVINAAYTKSIMTSTTPSLKAVAGDDMTMVPKYNYYIALDQAVNFWGKDGYVRLDVNGYGESKSHFRAKDTDISPAYEVFNLSTSLQVNENASVSLHVNNMFNKEVILYKNQRYTSDASGGARYFYYGAERNISLRLDLVY